VRPPARPQSPKSPGPRFAARSVNRLRDLYGPVSFFFLESLPFDPQKHDHQQFSF